MATRTSSQNGNWSSSSTWGGSAAPGDGDLAIVNHSITVDTNTTIGMAVCPVTPSTAPTCEATTGGSLTAATYPIGYAHVDANGNESAYTTNFNEVVVSGGNNAINVTLPTLPSGVSSYNLYTYSGPGIIYKLTNYQGVGAGVTLVTNATGGTQRVTPGSIYVNDTNQVTVNSGVTLTVKGHITLHGGKLILSSGSTLSLDPVTSSQIAYIFLGDYFDKTNTKFQTNGISSSRCTVSAPSGKVMAFAGGAVGGGRNGTIYDCDYTDFIRVGNSSIDGFYINHDNNANGALWVNCTFDNCGRIVGTTLNSTPYTIDNCKFSNSQHSTSCTQINSNGTGTRTITNSAFDKTINGSFGNTNFIISGNFFGSGIGNTGGITEERDISDCVFWADDVGSGAHGIQGNHYDCFYYAGGSDNPHFPIVRIIGTPKEVIGAIIEYSGNLVTDAGNAFYGGNDWTLDSCIILPGAGGTNYASGAVTATAGSSFIVRHCTLHSAVYSGGLLLGDGGASAGDYDTVKSNIFWHFLSESDGRAAHDISVGATDNIITPANCTHNGLLNIESTAYQGDYSPTQPGANDQRLDNTSETAVFVDPSRNLATWAVSQGSVSGTYAGKVADAKSYLLNNPSLIPSLMSHIRAGFAVKYTSWRTAGHDGTVLGAVQDAPASDNNTNAMSGLSGLSGILTISI